MSREFPDGRLPTTTARAIALAAVVGVLALTVHGWSAGAGALVGLAIAATGRGFDGSYRRMAVAAAALPAFVLGSVAVAAVGASPLGVALTAIGVIVGLGLGSLDAGGPSATGRSRARTAALVASLAAGGVAVLAQWIDTTGVGAVLETALWLDHGAVGLLGWLLVAGLSAAGAALVIPPAVTTDPHRRDAFVARQHALVRALVLGTVVLCGLVIAVAMAGQYVPPLESLLAAVAASHPVRGLLAAIGLTALVAMIFSVAVRHSWLQTSERGNAIVPLLVGPPVGVGACALAATVVELGASGGSDAVVAPLFGLTAVTLGAVWLAIGGFESATPRGAFGPAFAIAAGLVGGVVAVAATADPATTGTDAVRTGLPSLVAIGAVLFVSDIGRHGRVLAAEIGSTGASKQPQFVRCCWSGAVVGVGVGVAAGGRWLATVAAPTLSVPATAGVLAAVAAVVVGARLLLR